jgi:transposase
VSFEPALQHGSGLCGYRIGDVNDDPVEESTSYSPAGPEHITTKTMMRSIMKSIKKPSTKTKKGRAKKNELSMVNPNAAGIDIGSDAHWIAVPEDRDERPVRKFECFTADLHKLADWLSRCGIKTVAMESTGVYWIPLFQILESRGFDVKLVNARHVKNVPGRKTDVEDCQWIQQVHSYGLLSASFRPEEKICILRSYWRHRENLVRYAAQHIQHMQKALSQMNIQLNNVIRDISGLTGMTIIHAILGGERDTVKLAKMKNFRVHSSVEKIAKSLEGDYREEHLFALRQSVELYKYYQTKIHDCDNQIENYLNQLEKEDITEDMIETKTIQKKKNEPDFDLRKHLHQLYGVDFTKIPGLGVVTVQTIAAEVGLDHSRLVYVRITKLREER